MTARFVLFFSAFALLFACGGATISNDDSGGDGRGSSSRSSPSGDAGRGPEASSDCDEGATRGPSGPTDGCYSATDHVCGDFARPRECISGAFRCPAGTISGTECWCFGMNPPAGACSCTPSGWACAEADGGADADADAGP